MRRFSRVVMAAAALLAPALAPAQVNKVPDMRTGMDSPSALEAQKHLKEGQRLQSEDAFEEAAAEFQAAIALDPLLMLALYGLGTAKMA
jgi:hypothetical protein